MKAKARVNKYGLMHSASRIHKVKTKYKRHDKHKKRLI